MPIMENQMEKNMEHGMETGFKVYRDKGFPQIRGTFGGFP